MPTTQDLTDFKLTSIDDGCRHLSAVLGLDAPVSPAVLMSALSSDEYARNLLACRREPAFLQVLLANPVRSETHIEDKRARNIDVLKSASIALAKWSKVGFSIVSDDMFEARLKSCLMCPHIRKSADDGALFKLLKTRASCGLCGCDVEKKARLTSEVCPGADPMHSGYNRWGQQIENSA